MAHSIGKTISELRKAKGWTQVELAEKLGVSDKAVSKWESEGGFPEITQLPVLASLFGVSIDFLMTGARTEPQIVAMSRAELCAKNDDITMLPCIDPSQQDEDGKTLSDYVYQYESVQVFNACDKIVLPPIKQIKMALIANNFDKVSIIKKLIHISDKSKLPSKAVITDEILETILTDSRVTEAMFDYLLKPIDVEGNNVWYWGLPHLIRLCYEKGLTAKLEKLLVVAETNNQYAFDRAPRGNYSYNLVNIGTECSEKWFGIVIIPKETVELALANGDIPLVERFNRINAQKFPIKAETRYVASADEIRVAKLRIDKSVSADELAIQSAIHEGILSIDEIVSTKNYKLIKRALETHPITLFELKYKLMQELICRVDDGDWRTLFIFAVDRGYENLQKAITLRDKDACKQMLDSLLERTGGRNGAEQFAFTFPESLKGNAKYLWLRNASGFDSGCQGRLDYISACKAQILADCASLYDKETIVSEISKEYLEDLLATSNTEMLIIKLCVRLEAVLKCDYHLEGELSEMINQYCVKHGNQDDGRGVSVEADFVKHLHKLRKCRNSIVHSEKTSGVMTVNELKFCIDYICKMG